MFKYLFYILLIVGAAGLFWFLPKYSYVKQNPGYCVNLTEHLYYCGSESNLKETFEKSSQKSSEAIKNQVGNAIETLKTNQNP